MAEEAGDLARVHRDMQIVHRHLAQSATAVHLGQADDLDGLARHDLGRVRVRVGLGLGLRVRVRVRVRVRIRVSPTSGGAGSKASPCGSRARSSAG